MSTNSQSNEQRPSQADGHLIPAAVVPADDGNEIDSVYSETQSSTASLASSILEYRQIHGRTYHSDRFTTSYVFPNDDQQLESDELNHHYLKILLGDQLFLPPLGKDRIHRVLDVGTGSGIWAIEFADLFPNASVTGTDLSPCQPQWVPPNVRFEVDDASLEWTWNENHFDFIHIRYMLGGIQDWPALFKEAYRCCTPGGWVQSLEVDLDFRSDDGSIELEPFLAEYGNLFREGEKITNRPFFLQEIQPQAFDEAGFVDKRTVQYKVPFGPWAKEPKLAEAGRFIKASLENDIQGYTQMLWHNVLQRPADEYNVWLANLRMAIRNPKVHSYMIVHTVYGRKPE
ncbi:uncharacterized protein CPUR_06915 [Claviceps purpurea 20.1]|uniref:Methyltransferase n=1 Tax=Claviceps purpurea (strain 20.1) TaxID=1111077 RepID=M1VXG7_CLAP2|nr:uncharacterized protein CPUR_06915 [Claviceps purpurea 20.1]